MRRPLSSLFLCGSLFQLNSGKCICLSTSCAQRSEHPNIICAECTYGSLLYVMQGLELAEPPVAYASAAASAVANSIKALTGDDSVLVGVSLIRLGAQPHAHNTSSEKGAAGAHSGKGNPAADVAAKSSMLAMLTLYGVGAPSNAVQIAQRMQESCPSLFVYGASLTNSSCGRTIISNYVAAVLEAEKTEKGADSASASNAGSSAPTRTLLHAAQQASGVSFPISSGRLGAHSGGEQRTNTATATPRAGSTVGAQPSAQMSGAATASAGASASGGTAANPASNDLQAAEQQDPELAAFLQQSCVCLRVRQQPEVREQQLLLLLMLAAVWQAICNA